MTSKRGVIGLQFTHRLRAPFATLHNTTSQPPYINNNILHNDKNNLIPPSAEESQAKPYLSPHVHTSTDTAREPDTQHTQRHINTTDKRPEIPRRDPTNYGPWMVATRAAAHTIGAIEHITGNPLPPHDRTELMIFHKNKHYLLGKLITSIPPEIANLILTLTSDPTPYDLI